jgi:hypothetical protein
MVPKGWAGVQASAQSISGCQDNTRLAQRIVRDNIKIQIFRPVVGELMRLAEFEDEGVAGFNHRRSVYVQTKP